MRARSVAGIAILVAGFSLLALHIGHYPPALPGVAAFGDEILGAGKLLDVAGAIFWLAVLTLAAWAIGGVLVRALRPPASRDGFGPLYRLGLGWAGLALVVFGFAGAHALRGPALLGTIAAAAMAGGIAIARRWHGSPPRLRVPRGALWAVVAGALLCANAFLGAFTPEPGWDALTYHLAIPERYLFANGIVMTPFSYLTAYPFLMEMLFLPGVALQRPAVATLVHFEFGVLLLVAVYLVARRHSRTASILAPAILLADPLFLRELSWAYADLTFAFYALLAAIALDDASDVPSTRATCLAGALGGICVLVKIQGAFVVAALVATLWLFRGRTIREKLFASTVFSGTALAIASPWLLRNLMMTGNPVAPLLQSLFYRPGKEYFDPVAMAQGVEFLSRIGMGRSLGAIVTLPWNLVMRTVPEVYSNSFGYQITPLYVIGLLAALVLPASRREIRLRRLLAMGGLLTASWFFTCQEVRFLIPSLACFAAAGGVALGELAASPPRWGRSVVVVLVLAGSIYGQARMLEELPYRYRFALGDRTVAQFRSADAAEAAASALRDDMRGSGRVMLIAESRDYRFRGLDYIPYHVHEGSLALQWIHHQGDLDALECGLRKLGVTHVLINVEHLQRFPPVFVPSYREDDFARDRALLQELARTRSRTVFAGGGIWAGALLESASCPI